MPCKKKLIYSKLPNQWFFFNPTIILNDTNFYKISNKIGVVFFTNNLKIREFCKKIEPYVKWCKKRNIKFVIPLSHFWAHKYKPFGVLVDLKFTQKNKFIIQQLENKYLVFSKVHDFKEAFVAKTLSDLIFLSPVFKTLSYPKKKPLTNYIFISLCFFFKEKVIFALGGVNNKNFKFIKNSKLYGFGAISNFKDQV